MRHEMKDNSKGILSLKEAAENFSLERVEPTLDLSDHIQNLWVVKWDLGNKKYVQENIPFPCVNISWENDIENNKVDAAVILTGVWPQNYKRLLTGKGWVIGVKFRPGTFYNLLKKSVSSITGKTAQLAEAIDTFKHIPLTDLFSINSQKKQLELIHNVLRPKLGSLSEIEIKIRDCIEQIESDSSLFYKSNDLADMFNVSPRQLQRIFHQYVGVGPKWIIMRSRIRHAIKRLCEQESDVSKLAELAFQLGYYDQAHFNNEFKRLTGVTPTAYIRQERM